MAFVARHRDGRTRGHYEDGNSLRLRPAHVARHAEAPGNLVHGSFDTHTVRVQFGSIEDDALVENARLRVRVLLGGDDAASVAEERLRERRDDAFAIRPMHQEDRLRLGDAGHGAGLGPNSVQA